MQNKKLQKAKQKTKKGLFRVLFSRGFIFVLLILVQLVFYGLLITSFINYSGITYFMMIALSIYLGFVVINKNENPMMIITWLFLILGAPVFGFFIYLFVKLQPQAKRIENKYSEIMDKTKGLLEKDLSVQNQLKNENMQVFNLLNYTNKMCGTVTASNYTSQYFDSGYKQFEQMKQDLKNAKHFIFIETFIISYGELWTEIEEILTQKAKEGIEIRLLYDGTCTFHRLPVKFPKMMKEKGINCKVFSPLIPALTSYQNNRDHRKIVVIDNKIAYTGGTNFADEYVGKYEPYGKWKDSAIKFTGDIVKNFTLIFLRTWNLKNNENDFSKYINFNNPEISLAQHKFSTVYADNPFGIERIGENVYLDMINSATSSVHIMTPYLIPSYEMLRALTYAAKRGVEVKIIMPHIPDKKSAFWTARTYYSYLITNGVQIYEWLPGFVHSKIFIIDGIQATVGSINLDYRSLYLHLECNSYLYKDKQIKEIEQDFNHVLSESMLISMDFINKRPFKEKFIGKFLRLFAPLM